MCERTFEFDAEDFGLKGFRCHAKFDAEGYGNSWVVFHEEDVPGWLQAPIEEAWGVVAEALVWERYPDDMQDLVRMEHRLQEQL